MEPPRHVPPRFSSQLLIGLFAIGIGVLFTLDNLRLVDADDYLRYWPAGVIAIGLIKIWQSRAGVGSAFGGFVLVLAGTWLLLEEAAVVRISVWDVWPLLLVFFGGYLVWQGVAGPRPRDAVDSNAVINAVAVLGGIARGNNSRHFRGGDLTAVMGGCELDLRNAAIEGEATIDVFALWGGIEIRVPETWSVESRVIPFMGGFDDKTRAAPGLSAHRLVVRGFVMMAGVEVKN